MDKHGMDKERYPFPATPAELFALIDNFPLRKEEMKLQAEIGQSCPWFRIAGLAVVSEFFLNPRNSPLGATQSMPFLITDVQIFCVYY